VKDSFSNLCAPAGGEGHRGCGSGQNEERYDEVSHCSARSAAKSEPARPQRQALEEMPAEP